MKLDELWTYFGTALAVVFALVIAVTALAGGSITTAALVGAYGVGAAVLVFAVSLAVAGARRRGSRS